MTFLTLAGQALLAALGMFWEIFWALVLGFALSGVITAFVPKGRAAALLGKPGYKEIGFATVFGALSSSCSYAAASMTRSLFQKGAHIVPALAFLLASTNLVIELSFVLWLFLGWQFVLAEILGGVLLILIMALIMRFFGPVAEFDKKRAELEKAVTPGLDAPHDPRTLEGWRAVGRAFLMEWRMIGRDIALGMLISGFLMVFVPDRFWQLLFLQAGSGSLSLVQLGENVLIGPLVSVLSFVCSVGNIPLAAVLFHGGISFGGALSFIYADLIILPLILVYRRYFGTRLALWIAGIFYISMALAGFIVDLFFRFFGWVPERHSMSAMSGGIQPFVINYTFWLNIFFFLVAALLVWVAKSGERQAQAECCHPE